METLIKWWKTAPSHLNMAWLEHVVILLFLTSFFWLIWRFIHRKLAAFSERTRMQWDTIFIHAISAPITLLIWMWPLTYIANGIAESMMPIDPLWLGLSRRVLSFVIFLWFLFRLVNQVEAYLIASEKRDQTTISGLGHVFRILLVLIGILTALQEFGISLTGFLTFGGVGGLIMGLAAKDLLSNFFGGLMIYFDRPFKVGDWINSPDKNIEGTVERIGLRMTMIRSFESRPIYVPNSVFSSIVVQNPSRMKHRRILETIGLRYKDADKMEAVVSKVKTMLETHPDIEQRTALMVNFDAFAGSSLNFFIYAFTKTVNWARYNDVKQDVMLKIIDIVHKEGADFAFPSRTISFEQSEPDPMVGAFLPEK